MLTSNQSVDPLLIERWRSRLSSLTELILPTDYPRPIPQRVVDAEQILDLPESTSLAVLQLSLSLMKVSAGAGNGAASSTPFDILLAAFAILLHRYTGEEDITIGSSSLSSNPLVLRMNVADSDSMVEVIRKIIEDEVPFAALLDALCPANADNPAPSLFKVRFFNLTDTTPETLEASASGSSTSDITIFISQSPSLRRLLPIQLRVVYNSVLFTELRIAFMLDQLCQLLETAAQDPHAPIGKISLITPSSSPVLPDPTADLAWDRFEGAITDIFSRNAEAHPDRVCIVESRPSPDMRLDLTQSFTYQQIHHASNILAHHLIKNGIEREDPVVLYSYRGVDLVVAVMGVLKAGATFSVIDPAYPPSRQNIYLSVAQPRGLVVLKKAGALHDDVRQYITNELQIKCEVPALEIADDGIVFGGSAGNDADVLDPERSLATQNTGVVLGPDSIGTLSFTSGSTGIPKGVRGRHYSLTHFYPWMRAEFELSEKEHFTMLSGIAHDPIQRDIFTPLFLGASLYIPTGDDIGTPGRLAEWMAFHGVTITHLTPAMGQLLSANATHSIPTLRNAFFVGDVLTKRDVGRLQFLAPNTNVINMYGTTETQRAVSYLKIPPPGINPAFLSQQKDIMPAGKGMKDVQLLVVNPSGLLCGVGEVGEIYVRSGGLSEGYLRLEEVTAQKFLANPFNPSGPQITAEGEALPFYKGPRDRMYRSGDLGRYRPDGSVECTGRADDQVKIRGFRIELGDIDTPLSQHPRVRENVTLVRRNKDEEKMLVTYFVPLHATDDLDILIKDIREYLKQKLPVYAIPTVYVPLIRMPLTPNGKIDKNALPFPDTALAGAAGSSARTDEEATPYEAAIRTIWAELLNKPEGSIPLDDNFFDCGGHSILATRLVFQIRKVLAVDIALGIVYKESTIRGIAREVERIRDADVNLVGGAVQDDETEKRSIKTVKSIDQMKEVRKDEAFDYAADLDTVDDSAVTVEGLPEFQFPDLASGGVFFVTGVTGFLGAFILEKVLKRFPHSKVIALVRAKSQDDALKRIRENGERHLVWDESWVQQGRIVAAMGDLSEPRLGLSEEDWTAYANQVDVIIHNGALVHWVYPYSKLRAPNVLGTLEALKLATLVRSKAFHFVSSTSVLDTDHYARRADLGSSGKVLETDNLEGSRKGLASGYGQTKWVSEKLVMRARERGVKATIIRPGYIVGDSHTGVGNTDDFLWRLVKGCVQLKQVPKIANIVNMCPVDYVAASVAEVAASEAHISLGVFHIWNPHHFRFKDMFSLVKEHGYDVHDTDYIEWRSSLMDLTLASSDHALFPLLHFVLDDLPTSTKGPQLGDEHIRSVVDPAGVVCGDMRNLMGLYLGYLVAVGFLDQPTQTVEQTLPVLPLWEGVRGKLVARSGN
ncbi:uncharacterized protein BJ171DRAFT_615822 [Polychytrium aggregatum]|uniref:uncharacterized protein n=1 Tax=Polychytrium aggregatum TaxID=110093 RepID=UPI0022FDBD71|nr:uncharacterized protein BJ171DRAFT_615822 [Polychytrium aggregatum]KAI9205250.1 hypothetical protein BJ171DRAFT_615822 [Polychytrium aggregatum]